MASTHNSLSTKTLGARAELTRERDENLICGRGPLNRQIRLMTNSRKPQSEKLATGGGRGTTAVKPDNN
jgi:hypothetical protein